MGEASPEKAALYHSFGV